LAGAAIEQTQAQATDIDRIVDVFTLVEVDAAPARPAGPGKPAAKAGGADLRRAKKAYLSDGNAAIDKEWAEF
jgi:hypothetical protein